MDDFDAVRTQIDDIDHTMLDLLKRRTALAADVASYKVAHRMPVLDRGRERRIVADARSRVPDELKSYASALMELLMGASRDAQNDILGTPSTTAKSIKAALWHAP